MKFRQQVQGFTLIEVMITVAIIGTLAAIAMPQYTAHVRRGKVQEATSTLGDGRVKFEQFFQDSRITYAGFVDAACVAIAPSTSFLPARPTTYFTYSCTSAANTFTITATGVAGQGMAGYVYTINQANAKTSAVPGAVGATCWISKAGEAC